jgi:hypothetical protein
VRAGRNYRTSALGILGTVVIHGLLAVPLVMDLSLTSKQQPKQPGAGASASLKDEDPVITATFIEDDSQAVKQVSAVTPEELASRGSLPRDLPVTVLSPDPTPAADDADERSNVAAASSPADAAQHAMLYGRYLGQIQARIERAWMRPRTPIGGPKFYCRTRVTQDSRGYVIEIKLDHCNGTGRWQQSLVSAIKTASPLPAPPDPAVFADRLWLGFMSDAFDPNGSAEGFEPPSGLLAANNPPREPLSPEHLSSALAPSKAKDNANVIHLTIIGNRTYTNSSVPVSP